MTVVAALMVPLSSCNFVGQVPAALWVIFGEDRFHWDATTIGISLAAFGILHSLAQTSMGLCSRPARRKAALMLGMIADGTGYILLCLSRHGDGWRLRSCVLACFASGGIGMPRASNAVRQVDEERQGAKLQAHWRRSPA